MHVSFYCLFFGVGPNSSRMLKLALAEFPPAFVDAVEARLNSSSVKKTVKNRRGFDFTPFEGHQSRLGHYYRHLYQMVHYVDRQTIPISHHDYVKTIRAQLSTHEQALLLLNSLTPLGRDWWGNDFVVKYKLVQNLPRLFFSASELNCDELFSAGYFEWESHLSLDVARMG
jgi:hypothetical protein